jgi:uncharacterized protein (DUF697 family)/GTP-binding protein EngB required for normal cell division
MSANYSDTSMLLSDPYPKASPRGATADDSEAPVLTSVINHASLWLPGRPVDEPVDLAPPPAMPPPPPPVPQDALAAFVPGLLADESMAGAGDDSVRAVLEETRRHLKAIGRVNIVVAGQTGVGKSSLINAVFGEDFARTASGRPVTQHAEWFESETVPLRLLDTKGLEAKDYSATVNDLRAEIEEARQAAEARDQLHVGWVCIAAPSCRVQDAEIDVIRVLNKYQIPVIVCLTKYDEDYEDFVDVVERVLAERRVTRHAVVPVRAVTRKTKPAHGLSELVLSTYKALPAGHRAAFAAAQKVNLDLNREAAQDYVTAAAAAASAAALVPIPIADALSLAPIQAGMMVAISATFGLSMERGQVYQVLSTVMGCMALSVAGRWAVGTVLKLIPGPGSVIGGVLNAGFAGSLTLSLGRIYIAFLYGFISEKGRVPLGSEIASAFPDYFRGRQPAQISS